MMSLSAASFSLCHNSTALARIKFSGWAVQFAEDLQLKEVYDTILRKELQLSEKKLQQYKQQMLSAYYEVKEGESEQIYE